MSAAPLILIQPPPATEVQHQHLGDMEESLQALLDCEGMVPAELEAQYYADVDTALRTTKAKRDRYQGWLLGIELRIAEFDGAIGVHQAEIARLAAGKARLEKVLEKGFSYVIRIIQNLFEPDAKGKYSRKLEGQTVSFGLAKKPVSLAEDLDESLVPAKYRSVTISLPEPLWDEIADSIPFQLRSKLLDSVRPKVSVSRADIKADLTTDPPVAVPGARLNPVSYRLTRS